MLSAGRVDDAIAELNGRLSSVPADAESSNLLCRAYFALEDWDRAESSCKKSHRARSETAAFICGWGACTAKGRIGYKFPGRGEPGGEGPREFERAVQLNPDDVDARLDSGGVLS
jgi:hypothetical protein